MGVSLGFGMRNEEFGNALAIRRILPYPIKFTLEVHQEYPQLMEKLKQPVVTEIWPEKWPESCRKPEVLYFRQTLKMTL
ncbi:unnamed protein product [Victoria cruziana]